MKVGVAMMEDGPLMSDHLPITVSIYDDHVPIVNEIKKMVWDVENAKMDGLTQFLIDSLSSIHVPSIPYHPHIRTCILSHQHNH